ncbi:MAG: phosphatase PAP2 family protein, partial [Candidatus Thalassarchaeaceae archaeon]|nr:phosphatase PAP2 family protein [Candidatus Thalassarchaeaceae archaeon]
VYTCYFDDRHMADRISLTLLLTYMLALPFYLFFNVRVTGDYIPEMQTLGYHLTPEIQTWFTRIDPFTNGMPSLHIGIPFSIWYCYARNDLDGRWKVWRNCLIGYTLLTAFTILYLGIHWVSDIIGGIAVGMLSVHLSERIAPTVWWWLDERSFLHRVSWLLADWRRPVKEIQAMFIGGIAWFKLAGSRQTGVAIMLLLAGTGGTLLWDATHQHFPAEGVTHPGSASGADGWLASYEIIDEGNITVTLWNLSTEESYQQNFGIYTDWGNYPVEILIGESHIVVWHGYQLDFFNLSSNQWEGQWLTGPLFDDIAMLSNGEVLARDDWPRMVMLNEGGVEIRVRGGIDCTTVNGCSTLSTVPNGPVSMIASHENRVAYTEVGESLSVHIQTIDGIQQHITVELNATIGEERDNQVFEMTDTLVDYENATITEIALDENHLVALVNLSAINRLVLVDLSNGEQQILGDPVFPVAAPSIGHGYVAWQHHQFLISNNPAEMYLDWDVNYHDVEMNQSYQLNADDEIDQLQPQVMEDHIAWLQVDEDNETEIRVFTIEVVLEPYSSTTLQLFILLLPFLLLIWTGQRLNENEGHIMPKRQAKEEEE